MLAFNSKHTSIKCNIKTLFFTVEGGGKAVDTVSEILSLCGNRFKIITSENKAKYHAAACFCVKIFVVSVCYKATELLQECGFSKSESESALSTLMKCNMDNILKVGCEKAITGPAAKRGIMDDLLKKHIEVLDERTRELYKELTNVIFDMKNGGIE